jgi:hypothetical protein
MTYLLIALAILAASNTALMIHARRLSTKLDNANECLAATQKSLRVWKRACARLTRMLSVSTVICNDRITHDRN